MKTAQIVGLCVLCSVVSGGTVAMMGSAQPEPKRSNTAELMAEVTSLYNDMSAVQTARCDEVSKLIPPVCTGTSQSGFILVVTASGEGFVVDASGDAKRVTYTMTDGTPASVNLRSGSVIDRAVILQGLLRQKRGEK